MGYIITGITLASSIVMTANYYDHYDFRTLGGFLNMLTLSRRGNMKTSTYGVVDGLQGGLS